MADRVTLAMFDGVDGLSTVLHQFGLTYDQVRGMERDLDRLSESTNPPDHQRARDLNERLQPIYVALASLKTGLPLPDESASDSTT